MAKATVLLKVTSRLGEKQSKDGKPHKAKRFVPFCRAEELASDPMGVLKRIVSETIACAKDKKISGVTIEGESVEDYPFVDAGTGKTGAATMSVEILHRCVESGMKLMSQQAMNEALRGKYGVEKSGGAAPGEDDDSEVL